MIAQDSLAACVMTWVRLRHMRQAAGWRISATSLSLNGEHSPVGRRRVVAVRR